MPDIPRLPDASADAYLRRIGVDPAAVDAPDRGTLSRLQRAHATTVPFENLAITGDPHGPSEGEGISLDRAALYEKVVERQRGGYCYELNGLFAWLLAELGYDVDRVPGMMLDDDGTARPPANHLVLIVRLDDRHVVDVGMGGPRPRNPLPLDGTAVEEDATGVAWRVADSGRPDATHLVQFRNPGEDWTDRYVFDTAPKDLDYFRATCDYFESAPESPFTGTPVVVRSTERGYRKLSDDTLTRVRGGKETEEPVAPGEWHDVLQDEFGIPCDGD